MAVIPAKIEIQPESISPIELNGKEYIAIGHQDSFIRKGGVTLYFSEERQIALFKTEQGFRAVSHICPHQHAAVLADGLVQDDTITCPLHGWMYSLATGQALGGGARLPVYDVQCIDGIIHVEIPPDGEPSWMKYY